jgi:hypothetical protein
MTTIDNTTENSREKGAALIVALLIMALLLAMVMGISLTAVSELGVSRTYSTQTVALQAAEAGLDHAASLVANYSGADFTSLLALRPTPLSTDYMAGNNPFVTANANKFAAGCSMIEAQGADPGCQLRDGVTGAAVLDVYYKVSLIDDEPSTSVAEVKVPNFTPGVTYRENDADAKTDKNNRMVIYSTGMYANASVTLEGWVAFLPYPAFSANDDITIGGNSQISGLYGGVHSNSDLISVGGAWSVEQTATASGSLSGTFAGHVGGFYGGGQARLDIPPLVTNAPLASGGPNTTPRLQDFLIRKADVLLLDPGYADGAHETTPNGNGNAGTVRLTSLATSLNIPYLMLSTALDSDPSKGNNVQQTAAWGVQVTRDSNGNATGVVKVTLSNIGWSYSGGANAAWSIDNNNNGLLAGGRSYYAIGVDNYNLANPASSTSNGGNIKLTGNVGSNGAPLAVTMFATGSIEVAGTPNLTSNLTGLVTPLLPPFVKLDMLMAAVEDVKVNGDFNSAISFSGISYAGEQVELSGNGSIDGQVIALSNRHITGSPVSANSVTGSFDLTLNNGNSIGRIRLFSWRQIKR